MIAAAAPHSACCKIQFWIVGRIETEGLALMARDMGVRSFGLPYEEVEHL